MSKYEIKKGEVRNCPLCNKEIYSYHKYLMNYTKRKTLVFIHLECYYKECKADVAFTDK